MYKTFTRLMIFAVGALISAFACGEDSILHWMVDSPSIEGVNGAGKTTIDALPGVGDMSPPVAGVRFAVLNADGSHRTDGEGNAIYLNIWVDGLSREDAMDVAVVPNEDSPPVWKTAKPLYSDLTPYATDPSVKFAIEIGLFTGDDDDVWTILATSQMATYDELHQQGFVHPNEMTSPEHQPWKGGQYSVPEPTSGMLVLIGGALLALRRRRK